MRIPLLALLLALALSAAGAATARRDAPRATRIEGIRPGAPGLGPAVLRGRGGEATTAALATSSGKASKEGEDGPPPWVLLDAEGRPLDPRDERWLRLEEEVDDALLDTLPDAARERALGEAKMVEALSGPFVRDVTADLRWRVVRGGWVLATARPEPEPDGQLRIDVGALRSRMGTLEVEVVRTETGALVPSVIVEIQALDRDASGRVWFRHSRAAASEADLGCFRFAGIPEGEYEVAVCKVRGFGGEWGRMAVGRALVRGGATAHLRLALDPPARVPFVLRREDGTARSYANTAIEYRDEADRRLALSVGRTRTESVGGDFEVGTDLVLDAPPGRGWLVWQSNTWPFRAVPGPNPVLACAYREPVYVAVLVALDPAPPTHAGLPVFVRVRTTEGITVATDRRSYEVDGDGLLDVYFELIPGAYDVEWRLPTGTTGRARIEVPEGEETVVVDLR